MLQLSLLLILGSFFILCMCVHVFVSVCDLMNSCVKLKWILSNLRTNFIFLEFNLIKWQTLRTQTLDNVCTTFQRLRHRWMPQQFVGLVKNKVFQHGLGVGNMWVCVYVWTFVCVCVDPSIRKCLWFLPCPFTLDIFLWWWSPCTICWISNVSVAINPEQEWSEKNDTNKKI